MREAVGAGYLARVEANRIGLRATPGAVFLRLIRDFASEGQTTSMFTEMTPAEVRRLIQELEAAAKAALASSPSPACGRAPG